MTAEGTFPKSDGDILYASEVNQFHNRVKQIYTDTGFDSTITGSGTNEDDHELTAVASTQADYLKISIRGVSFSEHDDTSDADRTKTELKAQIKETGGAYADILSYSIHMSQTGGRYEMHRNGATFVIYHTLTAGQKSNGYQIKVFSKSTGVANTQVTSFTNVQTVLEEL